MDLDLLLGALVTKIVAGTGRPTFAMRAQGRPSLPYCVVTFPPAFMPPEPPEAPVLAEVGVKIASVSVASYGRTAVDVLALDSAVWATLTDGVDPAGIIYVSGTRAGSSEGHTDTVTLMRHAYQVAHL